MASSRTSGSHLVGINVVVLSVCAQRKRRQHRNPALLPQSLNPARLCKTNLTHESQIIPPNILPTSAERHPISAAESNSRHPRRLDRSHNLLIHHAAQHHQCDVASLGIGDSQAADELTLL